MKAMWVTVMVLAACDGNANVQVDARLLSDSGGPDAGPYQGSEFCVPLRLTMTCSNSLATMTTVTGPWNPMYVCSTSGTTTVSATCSSGCSLAVNAEDGQQRFFGIPPNVLCTETAVARVGDDCTKRCLPTRAELASDGTVLSQAYLGCDTTTLKCVASSAPVIANYLAACDANTLTNFGTQGVNGVYASALALNNPVCLLAWDDASHAITSGITNVCAGDWDCPEGSLCDDQLTAVNLTVAVCKPGPRGTLTPAMLSH